MMARSLGSHFREKRGNYDRSFQVDNDHTVYSHVYMMSIIYDTRGHSRDLPTLQLMTGLRAGCKRALPTTDIFCVGTDITYGT